MPRTGAAPAWDRTSDFMVGNVVVAIILPQCVLGSGSDPCTEEWTSNEIDEIMQETRRGLDWWEDQALAVGAHVTFQIADGHPTTVPTMYEPIARRGYSTDIGCNGEEELWINDVMTNLGYGSGEDYRIKVRRYDNDLREHYHADWAFTMFVADSTYARDSGFFATTQCTWGTMYYFGWAYMAGPFFVINDEVDDYDNFMDGVAAHEVGHVFGAPDETNGEHCRYRADPWCRTQWGYLGGENQNCLPYDTSPEPSPHPCEINIPESMMRTAWDNGTGNILNVLHPYTHQHLGWYDGNSNYNPDTLDTTPQVTFSSTPPSPYTHIAVPFQGVAEDIPAPSHIPITPRPVGSSTPTATPPPAVVVRYPDETINKILSVEYRVSSGPSGSTPWMYAHPSDGAFNSASEDFYFNLLACQNGTYTIQVRATNTVYHVSNVATYTVVVNSNETCKRGFGPVFMGNTVPTPTPSSPYPAPGEEEGTASAQQANSSPAYPGP